MEISRRVVSEDSRHLSLMLERDAKGALRILSAEAPAGAARMRLTFFDPPCLSAALAPDMAQAIEALLAEERGASSVVSIPDFALELGAVRLQGARLMFGAAEAGAARIMLRFRAVLGDIAQVFNRDVVQLAPPPPAPSDAVLDLYLPLANLRRHLSDVLESGALGEPWRIQEELHRLDARLERLEDGMRVAIIEETRRREGGALTAA